ncbi:MAG: hypothetical protein JWM17_3103 [Actinobacteria bacterium]|nr:hypothetical protein [Actinomycetota bacterium]
MRPRPRPTWIQQPELPSLGRRNLTVGHAQTGQHGRAGEVAIPPVEVVVPPHRPGGKPHLQVVGELPLDRSTYDLPHHSVGEFGLHLASAAVHADERLVGQIHVARVVPRPPPFILSRPGDERGKLVEGWVTHDGLDPVESGNAVGGTSRLQCRRYIDIRTTRAARSAVLGFPGRPACPRLGARGVRP